MTKIAKALFEPIIRMDTVLNRNGNPYTITPTMAKAWWEQTSDIPGKIKIATGTPELIADIGDYFYIVERTHRDGTSPQIMDMYSGKEVSWDYRQFDLEYCNVFFKDNVWKIQNAYEEFE